MIRGTVESSEDEGKVELSDQINAVDPDGLASIVYKIIQENSMFTLNDKKGKKSSFRE